MIFTILLFLSGISISVIAEYYSIVGLMAIFSAAPIPVAIMGISLGVGKLVQATWLKANWTRLPVAMKSYGVLSVCILMLITTLGCFGFLSKAHNDQNLVSGDVQSKIAVYDEKIKTEKENIEANRKALKQMDEGVDQVLGRSTDEKGADKAVAIRRSQQKERARLQAEISQSQKSIAELNDARAPIAAEVRKVEAEVGPIKYIAKFIYGEHGADENMLEKAVTWIIVLIVIVFDPLAVVMLLAAQMTYQWHMKRNEEDPFDDIVADMHEQTIDKMIEQDEAENIVNLEQTTDIDPESVPPAYLSEPFVHFENLAPMVAPKVEPEPKLETTPFDPIPGADARTLIVDDHNVENLRSALDEANGNVFELANYVQSLQNDYATITELHQKSMNRESDLVAEIEQLKQAQVQALIPEPIQERLSAGEHISISEMPDFQDFIRRGLDDGSLSIQGSNEQAIESEVSTQQNEPLIKPLEGEAAYNLMKEIGIFTPEGKLAPEYGGEEEYEDDQDDSASTASVAPINVQPESLEVQEEHKPVEVNKYTNTEQSVEEPAILKFGVDVIDRPGDYITDPVTELFTKREPKNGFGSEFPNDPVRGDLFLRTDFRPSRLFKWNDTKWIEVNKNVTGAYAYNDAYIQYLAEQVMSGAYAWDDLTETEIEQVQTLIGGRRG